MPTKANALGIHSFQVLICLFIIFFQVVYIQAITFTSSFFYTDRIIQDFRNIPAEQSKKQRKWGKNQRRNLAERGKEVCAIVWEGLRYIFLGSNNNCEVTLLKYHVNTKDVEQKTTKTTYLPMGSNGPHCGRLCKSKRPRELGLII